MTTSEYVASLVSGDGGDTERWQKAYHALINSENLKEKVFRFDQTTQAQMKLFYCVLLHKLWLMLMWFGTPL
ncbi:MAG: hypothetical protein VYA60_05060 [Pseudomonadota bacterium]|nr:hypothetical protein [Pseudomonadota bacterium]